MMPLPRVQSFCVRPCFAAIGAIKREMNNARWTWFAIGYQCVLAYAVALMVDSAAP